MWARVRGAVERRAAALHHPEDAELRRAERVERDGVGLGDVARRVDPVVHAHHDAATHGLATGGERHGVVEVHRAVGRDRRRRPHGPHQHDRLGALDHEVEEVRRLLQRVGAVGDHDAGHVVAGEQLVDPPGEGQPVRRRHVLARDLEHLLAADAGHRGKLRDRRDQRRDADRRRGVPHGGGGGGGGAGDGAAGGQDRHVRQRRRLRRLGRRGERQGKEREGKGVVASGRHGGPPQNPGQA